MAIGLTGRNRRSTPASCADRCASAAYPLRRLLVLASIAIGGCDDAFSPFESTDVAFSIYGYLDASRDTQWIRVVAMPRLVVGPDTALDAVVAIEHMESGEISVLRDSVSLFQRNITVGADGLAVHTYWTDRPVQPASTYRLESRGSTGSAQAVVKIPPDYPVVHVGLPGPGNFDYVQVPGIEHLAMVRVLSHLETTCAHIPNPWIQVFRDISIRPDGSRRGTMHPGIPFFSLCSIVVERQEIQIVVSGAPWPEEYELSPRGLGINAGHTTVSGGVGFFAGVFTKLLPYERCGMIGVDEHCEITYGPGSASVRGSISDGTCGSGSLRWVTVRMTEEPPGGGPARVRTTSTDREGRFSIQALEASLPHRLEVGGDDLSGDYVPQTRSVRLEAGKSLDLGEFNLTRRNPEC